MINKAKLIFLSLIAVGTQNAIGEPTNLILFTVNTNKIGYAYDGEGVHPIKISLTFQTTSDKTLTLGYYESERYSRVLLNYNVVENIKPIKGATIQYEFEMLPVYGEKVDLHYMIVITTNDRIELRKYDFDVGYPNYQPDINVNELEDYKFSSIALTRQIVNNVLVEEKEEYDFSNVTHDIENDVYYKFSFENFSFYCKSQLSYSFLTAYLTILDSENLFPNFHTFGKQTIWLPLEIEQDGQLCKLSLKKYKYYVNLYTLDMSTIYRKGYVMTEDIYLPKNCKSILNGKEATIQITKSGYGNNNLTITTKLNFDRNIVGSCSDSEYCVVGGVYG